MLLGWHGGAVWYLSRSQAPANRFAKERGVYIAFSNLSLSWGLKVGMWGRGGISAATLDHRISLYEALCGVFCIKQRLHSCTISVWISVFSVENGWHKTQGQPGQRWWSVQALWPARVVCRRFAVWQGCLSNGSRNLLSNSSFLREMQQISSSSFSRRCYFTLTFPDGFIEVQEGQITYPNLC